MRFRGVRTRLLLVVLAAVSLGLVAATIGFNILIASSTDSTEISRLRQRANEERGLMRIDNGVPVPTEVHGRDASPERVGRQPTRGSSSARPTGVDESRPDLVPEAGAWILGQPECRRVSISITVP